MKYVQYEDEQVKIRITTDVKYVEYENEQIRMRITTE